MQKIQGEPSSARQAVDVCQLCSAIGVQLLDSHILPKWAYRRAMGIDECGAKTDPVLVDKDRVFFSSRETKEHLLCKACEQRLGLDEDYVSRLAYQEDGRLGLLDVAPVTRMRAARIIPVTGLNCQSLVRFAVSVFWRAHVSSRPECRQLFLWNPHAESLRRYLLGQADLPVHFCITMYVLMDSDAGLSAGKSLSALPVTAKKGADGSHQLLIAGLLFNLSTGDSAAAIERTCLHCGIHRAILVSHPSAVKMLRKTIAGLQDAVPKGKLARIQRP